MPAPLGPLLGFAFGVCFAWAAAAELARAPESSFGGRAFVSALTFGLLVHAPAAGFFLAYAPAWSYSYLGGDTLGPSATDVVLVLLNAGSVPLGFVAAARLAAQQQLVPILRLAGVPLLIGLAYLVVSAQRLRVVGSYAQFRGSFGLEELVGSRLGYATVFFAAVLLTAAALTAFNIRRMTAS